MALRKISFALVQNIQITRKVRYFSQGYQSEALFDRNYGKNKYTASKEGSNTLSLKHLTERAAKDSEPVAGGCFCSRPERGTSSLAPRPAAVLEARKCLYRPSRVVVMLPTFFVDRTKKEK